MEPRVDDLHEGDTFARSHTQAIGRVPNSVPADTLGAGSNR